MNMKRIFINSILQSSAFCVTIGVSCLALAQSPVVYKHTDENGRVSYSNSPRKGAVVVDLAPLTVMSGIASATGKRNTVAVQSSDTANATLATPTPSTSAATNSDAMPVPTQTSTPVTQTEVAANLVSTSGSATVAAPRILPAPPSASVANKPSSAVAAGIGAAAMAQQRREDVRRRILEGEIEAEELLMAEARNALNAEQARSPAMRTLRASLPNEDRLSETTKEARVLIERHFGRIRDLQDQMVMHQQNISELRELLASVSTLPRLLARNEARVEAPVSNAPLATVTTPKRESRAALASANPKPKTSPNVNAPITDANSISGSSLPVVKLKPVANLSVNATQKRSLAEDR